MATAVVVAHPVQTEKKKVRKARRKRHVRNDFGISWRSTGK